MVQRYGLYLIRPNFYPIIFRFGLFLTFDKNWYVGFTIISFIMEINQKEWQQHLIKTMRAEDTDRADGWFYDRE